ncbi:hypothetical protein RIF29_24524 [Crotalaria pallida]|uniref:Uncharacterized protein n=1 Tax=Crotalaria pallida TaxID=3830 RepID=A0AAN9EJV8_CROPI
MVLRRLTDIRHICNRQLDDQFYEDDQFLALDILGSTKWRVNKRLLGVVESIWDGGGSIAGLIDREDEPEEIPWAKHYYINDVSLSIILLQTHNITHLNGNNLSGSLPDELSNLSNLSRFLVDENQLSGPIPESFANLTNVKHLHMNNNSFNGQIPPSLSKLPNLLHSLVDNNNLSGYLPPEFSMLKNLRILQLDNNNFSGSGIPSTYANLSNLIKLGKT